MTRTAASVFVLGLLLGTLSTSLFLYFVWSPVALQDAPHPNAHTPEIRNGGIAGLKAEIINQRDAIKVLEEQKRELTIKLTAKEWESSTRWLSIWMAQMFIEGVAQSAEHAQEKSDFWTQYRLDNLKIAAACWKTAALLRMSEARIHAGLESLEWGKGAVVMSVEPNSNAANTGIRRFDIIVRYDNNRIDSTDDFEKAKTALPPPGSPVEIVIIRNNRHMKISVARGYLGVTLDQP